MTTKQATLYRMVMDTHVCPYGLKALDLLKRKGFAVDDRWLKTREETDAFKAPYRKDLREDFPLRGFVLCSACKQTLTASWSKGRNAHYPYYHCKTKGCDLYGKNIKKAHIEEKFEDLLQSMGPRQPLLELAKAMTKDSWKEKKNQHGTELKALQREANDIEEKIETFMERITETRNAAMIERYEEQIQKLQTRRIGLKEQARTMGDVDTSFEAALGTVFDFLENPYRLWAKGDLDDKRLVLKLAFAERLAFDRDSGFGTALTSLPFKVFSSLKAPEGVMVDRAGFEPA